MHTASHWTVQHLHDGTSWLLDYSVLILFLNHHFHHMWTQLPDKKVVYTFWHNTGFCFSYLSLYSEDGLMTNYNKAILICIMLIWEGFILWWHCVNGLACLLFLLYHSHAYTSQGQGLIWRTSIICMVKAVCLNSDFKCWICQLADRTSLVLDSVIGNCSKGDISFVPCR